MMQMKSTPSMSKDNSNTIVEVNNLRKQISFHTVAGRSVVLSESNRRATMLGVSNGYLFSSDHIPIGATIGLKVTKFVESSNGSITIGFTNCNPLRLKKDPFPHDAREFLERREYWTLEHNACDDAVHGDVINITRTKSGEIHMMMGNGQIQWTLMVVDLIHLPLYLFIELKGRITGLEICEYNGRINGNVQQSYQKSAAGNKKAETVVQNDQWIDSEETKIARVMTATNVQITSSLPKAKEDTETKRVKSPEYAFNEDKNGKVCIICCTNQPDAAFEPCGHVALCVKCAAGYIKKEKNCPICRKKLKSKFLKIYLS